MFNDFIHSLSDKEMIIFNFISSNVTSVCDLNIKELSSKLKISEYSINKFCKKLNVDNFENLSSVIKEISRNYSKSSNFLFRNTLDSYTNSINKLDEDKISEISKLIFKYQNILVLFSQSSRLVAKYLLQNLDNLNINCKCTSSSKQISRYKELNLILYLDYQVDGGDIEYVFENFPNKTIIIISDNVTKNIHDNCSIFIHIENQKMFRNFNTNCNGLYFIFCDLIISKIIELSNPKN